MTITLDVEVLIMSIYILYFVWWICSVEGYRVLQTDTQVLGSFCEFGHVIITIIIICSNSSNPSPPSGFCCVLLLLLTDKSAISHLPLPAVFRASIQ